MDSPAFLPRPTTRQLAAVTLVAASLVLAYEPILWLWRSWTSAAYASAGWAYALAVLALALWSWTSGPARGPVPVRAVFAIAASAALVRLGGQLLAVSVLSAVALAVDVYAMARALRLADRPRPVSPGWLALLFLFSLPLQMILERVAGYPLQRLSAELSCGLLGLWHSDLVCEGTRLKVAGHDVLVDLPCAGAAGLVIVAAVTAGLCALTRPRLGAAIGAALAAIALACLGNALRITALAEGLARGWPVMEAPWHEAIGLLTLAVSLAPLLLWFRPTPAPRQSSIASEPLSPRAALATGLMALLAAITIVSLKARPVDISRPLAEISLPHQMRGALAVAEPLSPIEERYFRAYGGQAAKAHYGPMSVIKVATTSPLRHLHGPEDCLRGMGYDVRFLGTSFDGLPTAIYRAESPEGAVWQVSVSFVSDTGAAAPSIGTVVWLWLTGEGRTWTSLQRITPLAMPEPERRAWDAAVFAAFDLTLKEQI